MYKYLKYYNLRVRVVATKIDKIAFGQREKYKNIILNTLNIDKDDSLILFSSVTKDGKKVQDNDTFTVTCLAIPKHMEAYPTDENIAFEGEDTFVKDTWTGYISDGDAILAEPEDYVTLR